MSNWLVRAGSALVLAGLVAHAVPAYAAVSPPEKPAATMTPPGDETPDSVTHHIATIDGRSYPYTARAGTIALRDSKDHISARMFYTAYTLDGGTSARPITFMYNGGPGSSTMWLRMGSFGPVRVQVADGTITLPAPYHIVNNEYSLLDKTDLVFIDMPSSGFGRIYGKASDFYGVDQDVKAFGQFIQRYITTFSRWNSPKFLFGESYGTTRSAALANYLQGEGVEVNGVVLLSSFLNAGLETAGAIGGGDWGYVLDLPTEAATAWYHHVIPNRPADLPPFLDTVQNFAMTEYLDALARGSEIPRSEYDDVVAKLHAYTGLSPQSIRNANLRIDSIFDTELLRDKGEAFGRLDSRFTTKVTDRIAGAAWDATDSAIDGPYTAASNEYLRDDLGYQTNLMYRPNVYDLIGESGGWDLKHNGQEPMNVAPDLAQVMTQNPHLRVFSANGYYDFATPYWETVYTLRHLNLDPSLRSHLSFGFYQSGHMVYLHVPALAAFKADLAKWYDSTLSQ